MTKTSFITFAAVSMNKDEKTNQISIDRFDINAMARNIVAVNEFTGPPQDAPDVTGLVHFDPDTGLRPIMTTASIAALAEEVSEHFDGNELISIKATGKSDAGVVTEYMVNVDPTLIVAVNNLDKNTQQVSDEVRTIVYFEPKCGMQPILTGCTCEFVMDLVDQYHVWWGTG